MGEMDFLTQEERDLILADVTDLHGDTHVAVPVTYRAAQAAPTFTPSTGVYTLNPTLYSLQAIRNLVPAREVEASHGLYQMGDLRFTIERAALPVEPTKDDRLVDGTAVYDLVSWDTDPVSALWRFVARKVT